jgi:hypothetical protein
VFFASGFHSAHPARRQQARQWRQVRGLLELVGSEETEIRDARAGGADI